MEKKISIDREFYDSSDPKIKAHILGRCIFKQRGLIDELDRFDEKNFHDKDFIQCSLKLFPHLKRTEIFEIFKKSYMDTLQNFKILKKQAESGNTRIEKIINSLK